MGAKRFLTAFSALFRRKAARRLVAAALAVAGASVGGALGVWLVLWVSLRSSAVRVPEVRGMDVPHATVALQESGLLVRVGEGVFDTSTVSGRVSRQNPLPGFELKRGGTVLLHPSLGKEALRVIDLATLPVSLAELELETEGLGVGGRCEVNGQAGAVQIVAQNPAAGELIAPGGLVSLLINRSPDVVRYVMPDFVGIAELEAARTLRAFGFRVAAVQRVPYAGAAAGVVLRQDPAGGGPVNAGAVVGLWVSQ